MQLSNIDLYKLHTDEFGKWIHALFGASWELLEDNLNRECSFTEGKEVFFLTLKKLLDDNSQLLKISHHLFITSPFKNICSTILR
jgi:hypothetical protein